MVLSDYGNVYLSIFKHVEDGLTSRGFIVSGTTGGVTLLDAYPDDDQIKKIIFRSDSTGDNQEILLPIISIEQSGPVYTRPYELGSINKDVTYPINLTIFAETHLQNLQLSGAISDVVLKNEIIHYDFDQSFSNPVVSGSLLPENYRLFPRPLESSNKAVKWSSDIFFDLRFVI